MRKLHLPVVFSSMRTRTWIRVMIVALMATFVCDYAVTDLPAPTPFTWILGGLRQSGIAMPAGLAFTVIWVAAGFLYQRRYRYDQAIERLAQNG